MVWLLKHAPFPMLISAIFVSLFGFLGWRPLPCQLKLHSARLCRHRGAIDGCIHDDVIKWKHFPRYWPFMRGIHRSPATSPHKGQWRGALMFSLICLNKRLSKQSWGWLFTADGHENVSAWSYHESHTHLSPIIIPPNCNIHKKSVLLPTGVPCEKS